MVSFPARRNDFYMFRSGSDYFQRRCRAQKRWLVLPAVLSLTLVGAANTTQSSTGDSGVTAARIPSSVPLVSRKANASSPRANDALLTGTILSTHAADARTIITDRRGRQRVYARGDDLADGGEVVEIHRVYVIVRRGGRLQRLDFSRIEATETFERATPGADQTISPGDYHKVLRHAMFSQPGLLLQLVGATAVVEGGHFRGYCVTQPENPAFLESIGLKPGDLLTAVNGVPLDTPDYGTQVLDAMTGSGELTFTVQRGSQVLVVGD
jgi:general secretion pathway protein C